MWVLTITPGGISMSNPTCTSSMLFLHIIATWEHNWLVYMSIKQTHRTNSIFFIINYLYFYRTIQGLIEMVRRVLLYIYNI